MDQQSKKRQRHQDFNLSYFTLRKLCDELRETWLGVSICNVRTTSSADIYLSADTNRVLFLSGSVHQGRIVDTHTLPPDLLPLPSWVARHIVGSTVRAIHLVNYKPLADMVRDRLTDIGVQLEDRADGTAWRKGENG